MGSYTYLLPSPFSGLPSFSIPGPSSPLHPSRQASGWSRGICAGTVTSPHTTAFTHAPADNSRGEDVKKEMEDDR